jgi:hypothetical protein
MNRRTLITGAIAAAASVAAAPVVAMERGRTLTLQEAFARLQGEYNKYVASLGLTPQEFAAEWARRSTFSVARSVDDVMRFMEDVYDNDTISQSIEVLDDGVLETDHGIYQKFKAGDHRKITVTNMEDGHVRELILTDWDGELSRAFKEHPNWKRRIPDPIII